MPRAKAAVTAAPHKLPSKIIRALSVRSAMAPPAKMTLALAAIPSAAKAPANTGEPVAASSIKGKMNP